MPAQNSTRRCFLSVSALAASGLFLGTQAALGEDAPGVSEHLDEVLALLTLDVPGNSPLEKQEALLDYFRNRKTVSVYEQFFDRKLEALAGAYQVHRRTADLALEHTFYGQPAYEPDFRGKDEIDWDRNPQKDKEWIWQFHRFRWLNSLAFLYVHSGDEKYAQEWAFEMRSWIQHMHQPENAFTHPGWRSLDTALRMVSWSTSLEFFLKSPALDGRLLVDLIHSLDVHCKRIRGFVEAAQGREQLGNWDIYHVEGLLFTNAALPERKKSVEEVELAARLMVEFQKKVLLDDGVINEFIPSYHSTYPTQFARLVRVCKNLKLPVKIPQEYMDRLEKSINAMVVWSHPDGTSPVFGDAWLGSKDANRRWIRPFLTLFDRPDWRFFASNGKEGTHPDSRFGELPTAGYYTMRSDWTDQAVFLITKNSNTNRLGHNQPDNMTFEISAFGQRLMSDSGCYNYSGEPEWRKFFRSPMVHQLVSLDDKGIHSLGKKIAQSSEDGRDVLVLENEPVPGLRHVRTFVLVDGRFFVIHDELSGPASGELRQHFQFLPGAWEWNAVRFTAVTKHPGAANLILAEAHDPAVSFAQEEGWISNDYMKKEERPAFAFVQKKAPDAVCRYATLLYPVAPGEDPTKVSAQITMEENGKITIQIDDKTWEVGI
ncbi:MAG: alginate lyase family protein [Thermoguttaceae bacterium]|nr:alginate lyase family protein [Thermoguttaceae bacterium]